MSRIGKKPIPLPAKVNATIEQQDVTVKGPKGELKFSIHPEMVLKQEDGNLVVERPTDQARHRALHGLTRALAGGLWDADSLHHRPIQ
jgi:large subunit ribosomal protein L6